MGLKNTRYVQNSEGKDLCWLCVRLVVDGQRCMSKAASETITETHVKGKVTCRKRQKRETCILMG